MIGAVGPQGAGRDIGCLERVRRGPHHFRRDPDLTSQRLDTADRHRAGGGLVRLQFRGAFDNLLNLILVVAPACTRSTAHQLVHERRGRRGPLVVTDRQPAYQRAFDSRAETRQPGPMARRGLEEATCPYGILGRPASRDVAHEHLVHDDREAIDIGALIELGQTGRLLRTHVPGRADRESGACEVRAARGAHGLRDPEIGNDRMALREQDVLRFDVAMQDAHAMRV